MTHSLQTVQKDIKQKYDWSKGQKLDSYKSFGAKSPGEHKDLTIAQRPGPELPPATEVKGLYPRHCPSAPSPLSLKGGGARAEYFTQPLQHEEGVR